jgi:putative transcriptional regulator
MITTSGYLTGQIIAAFPNHSSQDFLESVIFICKHDKNGAMGFVINHALDGVSLYDLVEQIDTKNLLSEPSFYNPPIFWGGPIEVNRGFVLHSMDFQMEHTVPVNQDYGITASFEILKAIMSGEQVPEKYTLLLGYAGWKSGQLEKEIVKQSWVTLPCTSDLLFTVPSSKKWEAAMDQLGAHPLFLSPFHGKA